jgi:deoxycytidine triphosphate deaminase
MLMTNEDIKKAIANKTLIIENHSEDCFKPIAYVARLGKRVLIGGKEKEIDVEQDGSITLKAGDFILFVTYEKLILTDKIAGHIGMRSYWTRKGLVLLAGMHIDPLWEGNLVIGAYNASPVDITLDYLSELIVVEFHQLSVAPTLTAKNNISQKEGRIPDFDKDFIRNMETQSLSDLGREVRSLAQSVSHIDDKLQNLSEQMGQTTKSIEQTNRNLDKLSNRFLVGLGLGVAFLGLVAALTNVS